MTQVVISKSKWTPVKIAYTVSDKGNMISDILKSLKSVRRFFGKQEIIVFYTPPHNEENFKKLKKLVVVKKVSNLTIPFTAFPKRGESRYGEKIRLCDVDSPNVIFLDTDTIVKKDLMPLLVGNYDFSARIGSGYHIINHGVWRKMFSEVGKKPVPIPNTGFMIFKNYVNREIKEEWLKLINSPLPNPLPHTYLKEQYALALAISGKKIKWMTSREHAFKWEGELGWRSYVVHGSVNPFIQKMKIFGKELLGEER